MTAETFTKHKFGKKITMVYDKQDFRAKLQKQAKQSAHQFDRSDLFAHLNESSVFGPETSTISKQMSQTSGNYGSVPYMLKQTRDHQFTTTSLHTNISNKHILCRTEEIHPEESRPFLRDPAWPRTDYAPSIPNYAERRRSPEVSLKSITKLILIPYTA